MKLLYKKLILGGPLNLLHNSMQTFKLAPEGANWASAPRFLIPVYSVHCMLFTCSSPLPTHSRLNGPPV